PSSTSLVASLLTSLLSGWRPNRLRNGSGKVRSSWPTPYGGPPTTPPVPCSRRARSWRSCRREPVHRFRQHLAPACTTPLRSMVVSSSPPTVLAGKNRLVPDGPAGHRAVRPHSRNAVAHFRADPCPRAVRRDSTGHTGPAG